MFYGPLKWTTAKIVPSPNLHRNKWTKLPHFPTILALKDVWLDQPLHQPSQVGLCTRSCETIFSLGPPRSVQKLDSCTVLFTRFKFKFKHGFAFWLANWWQWADYRAIKFLKWPGRAGRENCFAGASTKSNLWRLVQWLVEPRIFQSENGTKVWKFHLFIPM